MNFDIRTLERKLRQSPDLKKEYEKHLKDLPDEKGATEEIKVYEEETAQSSSKSSATQLTFSEIQES